MSSIADHKKRIKEHLEEIQDAVNIGIEKRPSTIGFHTSACAAAMLELYLHNANLISIGKKVNHLWFKRPHESQKIEPFVERKMPVSFEGKEEIFEQMYTIEENRDVLIYGNSTKSQIETVLNAFWKIKALIEKKLEERGEKLE